MSVPTHAYDDRHKRRYGLVRKPGSSHGMTLPDPARIPEVALDKIPDHVGPTRATPDGSVHIVFRLEGDPIPDALTDVDWLTHAQMRDHLDRERDRWVPEGTP